MNSPPKRPRTSEGAAALQFSMPPSSSRLSRQPSFQSPTRSSLAKAYPDVLERAMSRSPSRRPTDREGYTRASLGIQGKAFRPSFGGSQSPFKSPSRLSGEQPSLSPIRKSGVQSFTKPPRRLSNKIKPGDFFFGSPTRRQSQPLEESLSNTPEGQLAQELGSATKEATGGASPDFGLDGALDAGFMEEDPLEPDLPPTPTQLGLEKAPDRSKGLLSSSPSARQEKRVKRKAADLLQGSPLKTTKFQTPDVQQDETYSDDEEPSVALLEKRKSRRSLRAELQQLENEVAELQKWTKQIESDMSLSADSEVLKGLLSVLSKESSHINRPVSQKPRLPLSSLVSRLLPFSANIPTPNRETSPLPTNPHALTDASQSPAYLTAFAPLTLNTKTSRSASKSGIVETHTLTFTPTRPFPVALYNVSVVYETDPESQSVKSVSVPTGNGSKKRRVPTGLRRWIDSRLENPLLKLDVSTLCWGINRYWEASVARAQLWDQIDEAYGKNRRESQPSDFQAGVLTLEDVRRLVPHLERSTIAINSNPSSGSPHILLSNTLTLDDWTGEPQFNPEINVSADKKVNQETKKLFHTMLQASNLTSTSKTGDDLLVDAIFRSTKASLDALLTRA